MIAIGNTESKIHGMFVGDTKIVSVYFGDQRIFPNNSNPFELEPDWEEQVDVDIPEEIDVHHLLEQVQWISDIQMHEPEKDELQTYTLTEEQQETLNQLVQEMVSEDPKLDESSELDTDNVPDIEEISQELPQSLG